MTPEEKKQLKTKKKISQNNRKNERLGKNLQRKDFSDYYTPPPKIDFFLGKPSPCEFGCLDEFLNEESGVWCQECAKRQ